MPRHLLSYRSHYLTIHTKITFDFIGHKLQHLFRQRWLHPNPEGVIHHIVGVGQVAADAVVGSLHVWLSGEVAGKE